VAKLAFAVIIGGQTLEELSQPFDVRDKHIERWKFRLLSNLERRQ